MKSSLLNLIEIENKIKTDGLVAGAESGARRP